MPCARLRVQALQDGTAPPGTFRVSVSLDLQTCRTQDTDASMPRPGAPPGPTSLNHSSLPSSSPHTVPVNISIATVATDADGSELPDTFYPYYGSTLRTHYLSDAPKTFQAEFWPYAVAELGPVVAPGLVPGSFVAENISAVGFELSVALTQPAAAGVLFAVLEGDIAAALQLEVGAGAGMEAVDATAALRQAIEGTGGLEALVLQAAGVGGGGVLPDGLVMAQGTLQSRSGAGGEAAAGATAAVVPCIASTLLVYSNVGPERANVLGMIMSASCPRYHSFLVDVGWTRRIWGDPKAVAPHLDGVRGLIVGRSGGVAELLLMERLLEVRRRWDLTRQ